MTTFSRLLRGAGRALARVGTVVSAVLVGADGRPLPPAHDPAPRAEHRP